MMQMQQLTGQVFDTLAAAGLPGPAELGQPFVMAASTDFIDLENMLGQLMPNLMGGQQNFTMEVGTFPFQAPPANQQPPQQGNNTPQAPAQPQPSTSNRQTPLRGRPTPVNTPASTQGGASAMPQQAQQMPGSGGHFTFMQQHPLPFPLPTPTFTALHPGPQAVSPETLVRQSTIIMQSLQPFITAMHQQLGTVPLSTEGAHLNTMMQGSTASPDRSRARSAQSHQPSTSDETKAGPEADQFEDPPPSTVVLPLSQSLDVLFQTIHSSQIPILRMATALRGEAQLLGEDRAQAAQLAIQMGMVLRQLSGAIANLSVVMDQLYLGEEPGEASFLPRTATPFGLERQTFENIGRLRPTPQPSSFRQQREPMANPNANRRAPQPSSRPVRPRQLNNVQVRVVSQQQGHNPQQQARRASTQHRSANADLTPSSVEVEMQSIGIGAFLPPQSEARSSQRQASDASRLANPTEGPAALGPQLGPFFAQMAATFMGQQAPAASDPLQDNSAAPSVVRGSQDNTPPVAVGGAASQTAAYTPTAPVDPTSSSSNTNLETLPDGTSLDAFFNSALEDHMDV